MCKIIVDCSSRPRLLHHWSLLYRRLLFNLGNRSTLTPLSPFRIENSDRESLCGVTKAWVDGRMMMVVWVKLNGTTGLEHSLDWTAVQQ